jgi:hypothetical protein
VNLTQPETKELSHDLNFYNAHIQTQNADLVCPISDHPFWQLRSNALVWVALSASARGFESLLSSLVPAVVRFHLLANDGLVNGYVVSVWIDMFPLVAAALLYLRGLSSAGLVRLGLR